MGDDFGSACYSGTDRQPSCLAQIVLYSRLRKMVWSAKAFSAALAPFESDVRWRIRSRELLLIRSKAYAAHHCAKLDLRSRLQSKDRLLHPAAFGFRRELRPDRKGRVQLYTSRP